MYIAESWPDFNELVIYKQNSELIHCKREQLQPALSSKMSEGLKIQQANFGQVQWLDGFKTAKFGSENLHWLLVLRVTPLWH